MTKLRKSILAVCTVVFLAAAVFMLNTPFKTAKISYADDALAEGSVAVNFIGNFDGEPDGGTTTVTATAGEAFSQELPVQTGYVSSVWYSDQTDTAVKVDAAYLTGKLAEDGVTEINVYAHNIKPVLSAASLSYNVQQGGSYTVADMLIGYDEVAFEKFDVTVKQGVNNVEEVINAGEYTVTVSIKDGEKATYGEFEPVVVNVTVEEASYYIPSINWAATNADFTDYGMLYVFTNAGNPDIYRLSRDANVPDGYVYDSELPLANSVVRYTGNEISIAIEENDSVYTIDDTFTEVGETSATAPGKHIAKVRIIAAENYTFSNNFSDDGEYFDSGRGVTVVVSEDGRTATITKEWYIVEVDNKLVNNGTTDDYEIHGWVYNHLENNPVAPEILHVADASSYSGLTFSLTRNGRYIGQYIPYTRFNEYVNKSMPAGSYRLTFGVPEIRVGTDIYFAFNDTYNFTVEAAPLDEAWVADLAAKLVRAEYRYNGETQLYNEDNTDLLVWSDAVKSTMNPDRTGVWAAGAGYDDLYSDSFTVSYNLHRMNNRLYYTFDELKNSRNLLSPIEPNSYNIYYQLTANNYQPLVDVNDDTARRRLTFGVLIYDVVEVPEIDMVEFCNQRVLPNVPANSRYEVIYDTSEGSYIKYGTNHVVTLRLRDPLHYKWADPDNAGAVLATASVDVNFTIGRARNDVVTSLTIVPWAGGGYRQEVNSPIWGTRFFDEDDENFYTYTLTSQETGKEYVFGAAIDGFEYAPMGTYTLTAYAKGFTLSDPEGTAQYDWLASSSEMTVIISRGVNTWSKTPNVRQWTYGGYNKMTNFISAEARIKDATNPVQFKVTYDSEGNNVVTGLEKFYVNEFGVVQDNNVDKIQPSEALAKLPVGTYYLWSEVPATEDYDRLAADEAYEFKVMKAHNSWEEAPSIESWVEGKYDETVNVITAKAYFGKATVIITAAGDDSDVYYDSANGVNRLKDAGVGDYELKAYVVGTDNYYEIASDGVFNFSVFAKPGLPWWAILLIVVGSLGIVAVVFFILHQKGILQMLTGKVVIAMRARATIDATIAAVRANKVAAQAKVTVAQARAKDAAEARKKAMNTAKVKAAENTINGTKPAEKTQDENNNNKGE